MTTTLRAKVQRSRIGGAWLATVYINDRPEDSNICYSWPEALQQAHAMLASLDRVLMAEVHASRSRRRADEGRCGGCRDLGPHRNVTGCRFYTADPHTMEATA